MAEIFFLTGEIQSGKTVLCLDIFQLALEAHLQVGGLISPAVFEGEKKTAIDVLDLKSGVKKRLANLRIRQQSGLDTQNWSFDPQASEWGNQKLAEAVPCDLLLIDELGPLEFQRGEGWVNGFSVVDSGDYQAAILVIRPSLVDEAVRRWSNAQIINIDQTTLDPEWIVELFDRIRPD